MTPQHPNIFFLFPTMSRQPKPAWDPDGREVISSVALDFGHQEPRAKINIVFFITYPRCTIVISNRKQAKMWSGAMVTSNDVPSVILPSRPGKPNWKVVSRNNRPNMQKGFRAGQESKLGPPTNVPEWKRLNSDVMASPESHRNPRQRRHQQH